MALRAAIREHGQAAVGACGAAFRDACISLIPAFRLLHLAVKMVCFRGAYQPAPSPQESSPTLRLHHSHTRNNVNESRGHVRDIVNLIAATSISLFRNGDATPQLILLCFGFQRRILTHPADIRR